MDNAVKTILPDKIPMTQLEKSTINTVEKILESKTPSEYIKEAGIDMLKLYKNLGRIATDARLWAKDRDGDIIDMGPNDRVQLLGTELILKLDKQIGSDKGDTTNYNMTVIQRNEIIQRVNRLYEVPGQ